MYGNGKFTVYDETIYGYFELFETYVELSAWWKMGFIMGWNVLEIFKETSIDIKKEWSIWYDSGEIFKEENDKADERVWGVCEEFSKEVFVLDDWIIRYNIGLNIIGMSCHVMWKISERENWVVLVDYRDNVS